MAFKKEEFKLLFGRDRDWKITTGLADTINEICLTALTKEYRKLVKCAPRRANCGKEYFVVHKETSLSGKESNRHEEHYAKALCKRPEKLPRENAGWLCLLDYQFPLKAYQCDEGVGKVDLFGVTDKGQMVVVEMKVKPQNGDKRGDSPLLALMEGLRYAAIVQANHCTIAREAKKKSKPEITDKTPIVQLLAPEDWWNGWFKMAVPTRKDAGEWEKPFAELLEKIKTEIGVTVECVALGEAKPCEEMPTVHPVHPGDKDPIGKALSLPS